MLLPVIIAIIMEGYERAKQQLEGSPNVLELFYTGLFPAATGSSDRHPTKSIDIVKVSFWA